MNTKGSWVDGWIYRFVQITQRMQIDGKLHGEVIHGKVWIGEVFCKNGLITRFLFQSLMKLVVKLVNQVRIFKVINYALMFYF